MEKINIRRVYEPSFFAHDTLFLAQQLIGSYLVRAVQGTIMMGVIVETEAYTHDDPASHAYRGVTRANAAMFGSVGCWYVYRIYGVHTCLNIVARGEHQKAGAVLIRAIEPVMARETMRQLRSSHNDVQITNGPAKLCQALGIDMQYNGLPMNNHLYITPGVVVEPDCIEQTTRIGISRAQDAPWRFYLRNNRWVSVR